MSAGGRARAFLAEVPGFAIDPVLPAEMPGLEAAIDAQGQLRTTPAMLPHASARLAGLDGFFAARLRKL